MNDTQSVSVDARSHGIPEVMVQRLRLVVYSALLAFVVLASFGFYLIYNLTQDVRQLSRNMAVLTVSMDENMRRVVSNMDHMTGYVGRIDQSTQTISLSMRGMQHDMGQMNHNVSAPMGFMNSFMPWGSGAPARGYNGYPPPLHYGYPLEMNPASARVPMQQPVPPMSR
ncbi:hypothetical protein Tgr7_1747 [Thioalkalivibrio sulfidiphilus HL-EbGr7]|uniref:Uncharacterized protein n=2 Tax=Thioalkalivibrio TaxID=106633 RepID=B8GSC5_THISH|nr:hypothetical protein Tgr7_1747 [Thioalkalivibrio sulfidiphilus HL-EbGr7]